MRTARPVTAPFGPRTAASQLLHDGRRRGVQSTRGFRRSISPDDLCGDESYLRPRTCRVHAHRRVQILDDLLGERVCRRREVKMPSWEDAGPKFSAGEVSPRLEGVRMRDVVGAAKCGDRTSNGIPWIDYIPFHERK